MLRDPTIATRSELWLAVYKLDQYSTSTHGAIKFMHSHLRVKIGVPIYCGRSSSMLRLVRIDYVQSSLNKAFHSWCEASASFDGRRVFSFVSRDVNACG